jgi:DNA processing protein
VIYPSLADSNLLDVLQLIRTANIGSITFFSLIQRFGTAQNALKALPDLARRGGRKTPLTAYLRDDAEKEIAATINFGAEMILYGAENYPELLLNIADPPPILTVRGKPDFAQLWQKKSIIAMVGARNASANGCQFAQRLAKELGVNGISVVSGLARGIDTFAHKGSLNAGTIAVIASGIDNIYPPENTILYQQIFEQGVIISEQPFGKVPFAGSFPSRNRIIAGMSLGTVVVEASPKSGSLITARLALEYDREVFAIPGSPLDPRSKGCNQLIRQGAVLTESVADILEVINSTRQMSFHASLAELPATQFSPAPDEAELNEVRNIVADKLSHLPVSVDELIEQCAISANVMQTILLELELAGRLRRSAGNKVAIFSQL